MAATICSVGFPLVLALGLDPPVKELLVGLFFFLASMFMMLVYFGPRTYLLLTGADLNSKLQIVYKGKKKGRLVDQLRASIAVQGGSDKAANDNSNPHKHVNWAVSVPSRNPGASSAGNAEDAVKASEAIYKYVLRDPDTAEECQSVIAHMHKVLMDINMKAMQSADKSLLGSSSTSDPAKASSAAEISQNPSQTRAPLSSNKIPLLNSHHKYASSSVLPVDSTDEYGDDHMMHSIHSLDSQLSVSRIAADMHMHNPCSCDAHSNGNSPSLALASPSFLLKGHSTVELMQSIEENLQHECDVDVVSIADDRKTI